MWEVPEEVYHTILDLLNRPASRNDYGSGNVVYDAVEARRKRALAWFGDHAHVLRAPRFGGPVGPKAAQAWAACDCGYGCPKCWKHEPEDVPALRIMKIEGDGDEVVVHAVYERPIELVRLNIVLDKEKED